MMLKRSLICLLPLLSACTTGEQASSLREGMSPAQVEAVLGKPDGFARDGAVVSYQYTNRLISGWGWDKADYVVVFNEDRLAGWGPGQIRQGHGPNVGAIMVLPTPGEN